METIQWKVEGMHCSNCALSVSTYLSKQGLQNVKVNAITGDVQFDTEKAIEENNIKAGIKKIGYAVVDETKIDEPKKGFLINNKQRFFFTLPFTFILMLHMLPASMHIHLLMNGFVQLALCLPVFLVGMYFFGRSAFKSLQHGIANMDVLISIGALAAFIYSLIGLINNWGMDYYFFETTASIITLVFFGNYLEETSIQATQKEIQKLTATQKVMANIIAFDDAHQEQIFAVENIYLKSGDLVLIKNGEQVPADCKILWGDCTVNESIITGESLPVIKQKKEFLIGGSIIENGTVKAQVTAAGKDTVLSSIVKMVQNAQAEKPAMQKLADKISAIFVPVVLGLAVLTFICNYFIFSIAFSNAMMRAIAVLVISCPCAMGLATPAAIAVGLGRAAKNGVLFKNANVLEFFKNIKHIVFDKTGTLTTGNLKITNVETSIEENEFKNILYNIEKYSTHPIAKSITESWKTNTNIAWKKIEEIKGLGMYAEDKEGNIFEAGSYKLYHSTSTESVHNIYVYKNKILIGTIDVEDELRPEAKEIINYLHKNNFTTHLLSGDHKTKCEKIAIQLGIQNVIAEQSPQQKLEVISTLNKNNDVVMIGDGINDVPALAKATIGISLSNASQLAVQSADVILMQKGLKNLPFALGLGKHTSLTIKQNLFWAFIYNIVAIPIAAFGLLSPTLAALAMGFSDIVLVVNSVRLFAKKVF